jgi:hypothetical protein
MTTGRRGFLERGGLFALLFLVVTPAALLAFDEIATDIPAARQSASSSVIQISRAGFFERFFGSRTAAEEKDGQRQNRIGSSRRPAAPNYPSLQPNESLLSGIQRGTPARRAAALRIAERGRQHLLRNQHTLAVNSFEKALGLEATPYFYFYLSQAHYHLGNYRLSANFLDVAASLLDTRSGWLGEVSALRAKFVEATLKRDQRALTQVSSAGATAPARSGINGMLSARRSPP